MVTGHADATRRWIRRLASAPNAWARCMCFPHAGGVASFYVPLSRSLSPAVEVLAVQYPGRQDRWREACVDSVEGLADGIVRELGAWTDRPLALFGHSMGAAVAFEVALRLEERGTGAIALFASGRRGPAVHQYAPPDEKAYVDDEVLLAEVRRLGGPHATLLENAELRRVTMPSVRADYRAATAYRYRGDRSLRCPVVALAGDADPVAPIRQVRAWVAQAAGSFELCVFPGGHFYLTRQLDAVAGAVLEHVLARGGAVEGRPGGQALR